MAPLAFNIPQNLFNDETSVTQIGRYKSEQIPENIHRLL